MRDFLKSSQYSHRLVTKASARDGHQQQHATEEQVALLERTSDKKITTAASLEEQYHQNKKTIREITFQDACCRLWIFSWKSSRDITHYLYQEGEDLFLVDPLDIWRCQQQEHLQQATLYALKQKEFAELQKTVDVCENIRVANFKKQLSQRFFSFNCFKHSPSEQQDIIKKLLQDLSAEGGEEDAFAFTEPLWQALGPALDAMTDALKKTPLGHSGGDVINCLVTLLLLTAIVAGYCYLHRQRVVRGDPSLPDNIVDTAAFKWSIAAYVAKESLSIAAWFGMYHLAMPLLLMGPPGIAGFCLLTGLACGLGATAGEYAACKIEGVDSSTLQKRVAKAFLFATITGILFTPWVMAGKSIAIAANSSGLTGKIVTASSAMGFNFMVNYGLDFLFKKANQRWQRGSLPSAAVLEI